MPLQVRMGPVRRLQKGMRPKLWRVYQPEWQTPPIRTITVAMDTTSATAAATASTHEADQGSLRT